MWVESCWYPEKAVTVRHVKPLITSVLAGSLCCERCRLVEDPRAAREVHLIGRAVVGQLVHPLIGEGCRWPADRAGDDQDSNHDQAAADERSVAARRPRLVCNPDSDADQQSAEVKQRSAARP